MGEIENLKRRIELKEQLITITQDEIHDLWLEIAMIEAERATDDETPN